jgi:hypothetical protein
MNTVNRWHALIAASAGAAAAAALLAKRRGGSHRRAGFPRTPLLQLEAWENEGGKLAPVALARFPPTR